MTQNHLFGDHGEQGVFRPWPLLAALFLATGVALSGLGITWLLALLVPLVVTLVVWYRNALWVVAALSLLVPLGFARYELWASQPDPLAGPTGETATLSGTTDGRYLRLDTPSGVRVVLSPQGAVEAGRVTVEGRWLEPTTKRNPGGFDYQGYLKRRGVDGQFYVTDVISHTPPTFDLKTQLQRGVTVGLGTEQAALLQAMTLGIRDDLGDLRDTFSRSGLAHLLALSGLHVGILAGALTLVLTSLGRWRYPVIMVLLVGFAFLVGLTPSIMRAVAMAVAALLFVWLGGGSIEAWSTLGLAAVVTLLFYPAYLFDLSFQLSYLAVAGILLITPPLAERWVQIERRQLPRHHWRVLIVGSLIVSVAAQALSLPLVLSTFGSVSLLNPLVNLVAIPLTGLLVPLGFLSGVVGLVFLPLSRIINFFTNGLTSGLIWIAERGAALPSLPWGEISSLGYLYYAVGVTALVFVVRGWLRPWRGLLVLSVAILCSMVSAPSERPPEIVYLDVGQGDSVLIRLPGRVEILVDGGGTPFSDYDIGAQTVVPALRALGVDELELVIGTHADTDHIEGLASIVAQMPVQQLVIGVPKPGDPVYDALASAAESRNVPMLPVVRGQSLTVGDARLDILNPPNRAYAEDNDNSVAFVLNYHNVPKALFLGDISAQVEDDLAFPDLDIVMAGHHGSRSSSSRELVAATTPDVAVFSYGRNNYGHPNPEVVARFRSAGATVYETLRHGAVRLPLD